MLVEVVVIKEGVGIPQEDALGAFDGDRLPAGDRPQEATMLSIVLGFHGILCALVLPQPAVDQFVPSRPDHLPAGEFAAEAQHARRRRMMSACWWAGDRGDGFGSLVLCMATRTDPLPSPTITRRLVRTTVRITGTRIQKTERSRNHCDETTQRNP
ncbi:MAG: hypothetical protein ABIK09_05780 [Pseudomonadota bacterium]